MTEKIEVGNILEGKVVKIKPFGAIVLLNGNVQGLVHISQISNSFVENINTHLSVGDIVKVKVLSVDKQANKISLSIKDANPASQNTKKAQQNEPGAENKSQPHQKSSAQPLEDKIKDWLKQSNERQAGINKRNNRR